MANKVMHVLVCVNPLYKVKRRLIAPFGDDKIFICFTPYHQKGFQYQASQIV